MSHRFTDESDDERVNADELLTRSKQTRQQTLDVVRESVGRLRQTEEQAATTMVKLGEQAEVLHRAHRELHNASNNERVAAEQVTELKQANKLFGGFRNPFRSKSKLERAAMAKAQAETQADVHAHSEMRRSEYQSKRQTVAAGSTGTNSAISGRGSAAHGFASSAIESDLMDEEDRAHEREIDESLYEMGSLVGNLRAMAVNMNTEVRAQNEVIGKLGNKSDDLHVRLATTHSRVKNIK